MTYFFTNRQSVSAELLDWPPLRVYTKENRTQLMPVAELVCLESDKNYTWLRWSDGLRIMMPYTMKRFQDKLPFTWFLRINRQIVVNQRFIERIEEEELSARVYLTTGLSFAISRRRWTQLRRQLVAERNYSGAAL